MTHIWLVLFSLVMQGEQDTLTHMLTSIQSQEDVHADAVGRATARQERLAGPGRCATEWGTPGTVQLHVLCAAACYAVLRLKH